MHYARDLYKIVGRGCLRFQVNLVAASSAFLESEVVHPCTITLHGLLPTIREKPRSLMHGRQTS